MKHRPGAVVSAIRSSDALYASSRECATGLTGQVRETSSAGSTFPGRKAGSGLKKEKHAHRSTSRAGTENAKAAPAMHAAAMK
jgi:hypothetical protein